MENNSRIKLLYNTALISGVFCFVVSLLLLMNYLQFSSKEPLESQAMEIMRSRKVKSLVVERRDTGDAFGIITYATILRTIVAEEGDIDLINVYDVCTKPVISVPPGMAVKYVARLMVDQLVQRIVHWFKTLGNADWFGIKTIEKLVDGGYLFIGHSESLYQVSSRFELVGNTIYRKVR